MLAVGPMLDRVMQATAGLDVTVLYTSTVRPLDLDAMRTHTTGQANIVLVEPLLEGTSAAELSRLHDEPRRVLSIGVSRREHRRYGTRHEHDVAHGLDARGIREQIIAFLGARTIQP